MPSAYTVFYAEEDNTTHVMIGAKHPNCPNNGGQRALPGGRVDRKDRNNFDAARREFHEETLLDIPPPPPQGGFPNGLMAGGLPFSSSGRQFDGFYVAYIRMRNLADLTNISNQATGNLPHIPPNTREFTQFQTVTEEDAIEAFHDDNNPNNANQSTDWFSTAVLGRPS